MFRKAIDYPWEASQRLSLWGLLFLLLALPSQLSAVNVDSLEAAVQDMPLSREKAVAYQELANSLMFSEPERSLVFANEMQSVAQAMDNDTIYAKSFHTVGTIYIYMGRFEDAISSYTKGLEYGKKLKDEKLLLGIHINMGTAYFNMGNHERGTYELLEAKKLLTDDTPVGHRMVIYNNLGASYEKQGQNEKALEMYFAAKEIIPANDLRRRSINANNIGHIYLMQGQVAKGRSLFRESLDYVQGTDFYEQLATAFHNLSEAERKLGNIKVSKVYVDSMMFYAQISNVPHVMEFALNMRSAYLADIGAHELALEAYQLYVAYKDSAMAANQNEKMAELQAEMDLKSKEAEIEVLEARNQTELERRKWQNYLLWALGIGLVVVLIALVFIVLALYARSQTNKELVHKNDVIEEKNLLLQKQKDILEDLNREKDGLIGIVAHDLKSPLNKSLALINMIESTGPLNPAQSKAADMIRKSNEDGTELIRDLLELNSIEMAEVDKEMTPIEARKFLQDLAATFAAEAERKEIELKILTPSEKIEFQSHRLSLNRILENLISNALKFSKSGTFVQVEAQYEPESVLLAVRDQGPGISPEDQRKLFKKFQRLSAKPTGGESSTGLGLAITKSLVEKLGGMIQVESELGQGTAFLISLPRR